MVAVLVGERMVVQEGGKSIMTDDYEDLARLIAEIKEIFKRLLPPTKLERGYEIVAAPTGFVVELEIVDILQDMALEEESVASIEELLETPMGISVTPEEIEDISKEGTEEALEAETEALER